MIRLPLGVAMAATSLARGAAPEPPEGATRARSRPVSKRTGPLRIGIVSMVHGHVKGLLRQASKRTDLAIVGMYEPERAASDRLASSTD